MEKEPIPVQELEDDVQGIVDEPPTEPTDYHGPIPEGVEP